MCGVWQKSGTGQIQLRTGRVGKELRRAALPPQGNEQQQRHHRQRHPGCTQPPVKLAGQKRRATVAAPAGTGTAISVPFTGRSGAGAPLTVACQPG